VQAQRHGPPDLMTPKSNRGHSGFGDTYFLDEAFRKIGGKQHYLWRAVDQDGEIVDVYLQERRGTRLQPLSLGLGALLTRANFLTCQYRKSGTS
jgi:hypothetical protein